MVSAFKINDFAQHRRNANRSGILFMDASFIIARTFDNEIRYIHPFPPSLVI